MNETKRVNKTFFATYKFLMLHIFVTVMYEHCAVKPENVFEDFPND